MTLLLVGTFFGGRRYRDYRTGFAEGHINRNDFVQLNRLGFPLALQMGMETASFSLTSIMVGWLGTSALAAHQVLLTISQLFYMIYYGMAAAVSVMVSHYLGQRDYHALLRTSQAGFHIIIFIAFSVAVPVFLFRWQLGMLFTDSAEVSVLVAACIIPMVFYQFGDGLQCNYANVLRGISHVRPMVIIAFVAAYVLNNTRVGLQLRAVGEDPATADAAGINITRYKYVATCLGCMIAGLGGLYYVMDYANGVWSNDAFGDRGWLAIALVIFTIWRPNVAVPASILFGGLYILYLFIPTGKNLAVKELYKMLPYVVTIVVLVISSLRNKRENQPPESLGLPYFREER